MGSFSPLVHYCLVPGFKLRHLNAPKQSELQLLSSVPTKERRSCLPVLHIFSIFLKNLFECLILRVKIPSSLHSYMFSIFILLKQNSVQIKKRGLFWMLRSMCFSFRVHLVCIRLLRKH